MNLSDLSTYLGGLLDRPVDGSTRLTLTSGQQARLQSWMQQRGVDTQTLNLAKNFSCDELLGASPGSASGNTASTTASTGAAPSAGAVLPGSLGVDIQSIAELVPAAALADLKASAELARIFTLRELSYAQTRPDPASTLAGLFAAKEAVKKASPRHLAMEWTLIEILPNAQGAPTLAGFALSISHSKDYAVAGNAPVPAAAQVQPLSAAVAVASATSAAQATPPATATSIGGAGRYALTAWALLATAGCLYLAC
jgi:phosphopantetheinyl transferase (holo-ACP synthase)